MSYVKKILTVAAILLIAGLVLVYAAGNRNDQAEDSLIQEAIPEGPVPDSFKKNSSAASSPAVPGAPAGDILPGQVKLGVPFLAQAPFGIWDPLHEDACEEASLIMAKYFFDKNKNLTPTAGDVEIIKMVRYEEQNGYGLSITMEQLAEIIRDYYGIRNYRIEKNITAEDIKKELAEGRPVIVPAAGKILPNPNFRNGGPLYHMLVVIGYDKNGFITNDPGTRKGEGFRYTFNALYNAIHDWNGGDVLNGQKTYLVFDQVL
jgi:hypothetical protein